MGKGIITRKDVIEDEALRWGDEYAGEIKKAISAQNQLLKSAKELVSIYGQFRKSQNNAELIAAKNAEKMVSEQVVIALKKEDEAMIASENIRKKSITVWKEQINLENQLISLKKKNELATEGTSKAVAKERVQNQELNKTLKLEAREKLGLVGLYERLNRKRTEAQNVLANLLSAEIKNTAEIKKAQREFDILDIRVKAVDASTRNYSKNIGNYSSAFKGLSGTMRELFSVFGLATGLALFGTIVKDIFTSIKDFDRQLIAVGKTTNISGENLKQFGREVVELGDRLDGISVEGLLKSSEVAGQLGVKGTANILKFSEAVEKLKLTSNIISDEQVQNFAKFIEVSSDSFENADRLASVITQLGNNFASTEAEVLANATEIQKGTAVYKTSAEGILALGAATSALGSEAESSRSAIQSTFAVLNNAIALGTNLTKVLKITGLTQAELKKEFGEDATKVFQKFVKGLNTAKNEGQNLSLVLNELGIKEKRAFTVVGSLAANYELLERAMSMASEEYKNNIALNQEVEAASQSVASILGDIKDKWEAYILSTNDANDGTKIITTSLKFLRDNLSAIITGILKYGSIIITFLAIQKSWNFLTATWTALQTAAQAAQLRFALSTGIGTTAIKLQAAAIREATLAQNGLNIAVKATPWGLIIGLVGAAVVAYQVLNDELSTHEKLLQQIKEQNETLAETEDSYNKARDEGRAKSFKGIEDEIRLRKAKGEDSKKLDELEIAKKKEVLQAQIDILKGLKTVELERTKTEIELSQSRISQIDKELAAIDRKDKASGRTSSRNADRAYFDYAKEQANAELELNRNKFFQNQKLTQEEIKKLNNIMSDLDKDNAVKDAEFQKQESEKQKRAREKARKEYLASLKQAENDEFALREWRLKNAIDINNQIADDEKRVLEERFDAEYDKHQEEIALSNETLEHKLKNISWYDDSVRDLTQSEIDTLVKGGQIKRQLLSSEKLVLEQHAANLLAIDKKLQIDKQKLIDSEVGKVQTQIDSEKATQERLMNEAIEAENQKFLAVNNLEAMNMLDRERAIQEHEKKIYEIKKKFALDALKIQIDGLEAELAKNDALEEKDRVSGDVRKKLAEELQQAKTDFSNLEKDNYIENVDEKTQKEADFAQAVLDISQSMSNALGDLASALFERRIQNIDDEIAKNDEKYSRLIEMAGNDAAQRELLEQEAEKKRQELEKKKKKELQKQAIADRIMALAQVGFSTAMGIMQSYAQLGPIAGNGGAILVSIMGALQTAAVLAAPLPKYKHGREGGPAEFAEVGDGYVSEVIQKADGRAFVTPNRPTITYLEKGDSVYSSVEKFNTLQKASFMASLQMEGKKVSDFQAKQVFDYYHFEELEDKIEKGIAKGFKNAKQTIHVHPAKIDFGHEIWKSKNTSWN